MSEEYEYFLHNMWIKNCYERDSWGEPVLPKDQYIANNSKWLQDAFYNHQMANKVWNGKEYVNP